MLYVNKLLVYLLCIWRKHGAILFFGRIARLSVTHVTQLNCYDAPLTDFIAARPWLRWL